MMFNTPGAFKKFVLDNLICYILVVIIAFGLKYHYSKAGSDELIWILTPTARLVEWTSGIHFEYEAQTGFVNTAQSIIIAPSCAGVNFLIVALCMAAFCGLHLFRCQMRKLFWLTICGLNAYLLTIVVNTLRIISSIYIYRMDIYGGWLTPERMHRLTGIVIYFFFLCLFYMIINKGLYRLCLKFKRKLSNKFESGHARSNFFRWPSITVTPLFWYALITLGVPLMNAAYVGNGARFAEHIGTVAFGCIIVIAAVYLLRWPWRSLKNIISKNKDFSHHKLFLYASDETQNTDR